MRCALILCACLAAAPVGAQSKVGVPPEGEFPGLQVLPVGTVVRNITMPRYGDHKLTSLLKADRLRVDSRSRVSMHVIDARLIGEEPERPTRITTPAAQYCFQRRVVMTDRPVLVQDPRFRVEGKGIVFSMERKVGYVPGPVRTVISTETLNLQRKK